MSDIITNITNSTGSDEGQMPDSITIFQTFLTCFQLYMNVYNVSNETYSSINNDFIRYVWEYSKILNFLKNINHFFVNRNVINEFFNSLENHIHIDPNPLTTHSMVLRRHLMKDWTQIGDTFVWITNGWTTRTRKAVRTQILLTNKTKSSKLSLFACKELLKLSSAPLVYFQTWQQFQHYANIAWKVFSTNFWFACFFFIQFTY